MRMSVLAACLTIAAMSPSAMAQNRKLDFQMLNRTGLIVVELYVSPSDADEWGDDVLGRDILRDGETVDVEFTRGAAGCLWDLKIVDEDEDEITWDAINLCKAAHITLRYRDGVPTAVMK
jgi:hypothetical protein